MVWSVTLHQNAVNTSLRKEWFRSRYGWPQSFKVQGKTSILQFTPAKSCNQTLVDSQSTIIDKLIHAQKKTLISNWSSSPECDKKV